PLRAVPGFAPGRSRRDRRGSLLKRGGRRGAAAPRDVSRGRIPRPWQPRQMIATARNRTTGLHQQVAWSRALRRLPHVRRLPHSRQSRLTACSSSTSRGSSLPGSPALSSLVVVRFADHCDGLALTEGRSYQVLEEGAILPHLLALKVQATG